MLMMSKRTDSIPPAYGKSPLLQSDGRTSLAPALNACLVLILLLFTLAGCSTRSQGTWAGPAFPAQTRLDPLNQQQPRTRCITTVHYRIYTDIADLETLDRLAQLMEGAYTQYCTICPVLSHSTPNPQPMPCYLFARRAQWAEFTSRHTGPDAAIYLQIDRGAYTINDHFVAFWLGDRGTYAVASHEGFHQFVAHHFAGRIAPALEEGFACLFESVAWEESLPRWNLEFGGKRADDLARALSDRKMWPLPELLRLHAGDVISQPRPRIDAFYAQNWAFARFLWYSQDQKYRPAVQRYLADTAAGQAWRPPNTAAYSKLKPRDWNPDLAVLQLEHYLGQSLRDLEPAYLDYCQSLGR